MSIKEQTSWVPSEQEFVRYLEFGGQIQEEKQKHAKDALVLMASPKDIITD